MNTTAILAVAAIGFAVSAVSGYFLIPYLHKLHFGQTILDIGPSWHKNKQALPPWRLHVHFCHSHRVGGGILHAEPGEK